MTKLVLKNNDFDLNTRVKKQISDTAIGIKLGQWQGEN